jgi:ribosomal protein S18 acetylase RimI-like enzyme
MAGEASTLGLPPKTPARRDDWLATLTENGLNLVAVAEDRVLGHVAAVPVDDENPELVVFVHPEMRGRGVGTELLKQVVAYADERGAESLRLTVASGNRRAIHVYDNLGFDVAERLERELEMRLALDEPVAARVKRPPADRHATE